MESVTPPGEPEYLSDTQSDSEFSSSSNSQYFTLIFAAILIDSSAPQFAWRTLLIYLVQVACLASQALAHLSLAVGNQTQSSPTPWFQVSKQKHFLIFL